jgi:hypothetical protein
MSIIFLFHYFKTSIVVLNSMPCSPHFHFLILQSTNHIKIKFMVDRHVKTFRSNVLFLSSWIQIIQGGKFLGNLEAL